jgi:hypothetical protein
MQIYRTTLFFLYLMSEKNQRRFYMDTLTYVLTLSTVMWYVIDRVKKLWADLSWGRWITVALAIIAGMGISFGLNIDVLFSLGVLETAGVVGKIVTGLALASGASGISELIAFFKKGEENYDTITHTHARGIIKGRIF